MEVLVVAMNCPLNRIYISFPFFTFEFAKKKKKILQKRESVLYKNIDYTIPFLLLRGTICFTTMYHNFHSH